ELDWTRRGFGFRGQWGELRQSHRLPRRVREAAWEFARANDLDTEQLLPPEGQQELFNPDLVWHDEWDAEDACRTVLRLYRHLHVNRQAHPQDIAILVPTHAIGEIMVDYLRSQGEQPNHVFHSQERNHSEEQEDILDGKPRGQDVYRSFFQGMGVRLCDRPT